MAWLQVLSSARGKQGQASIAKAENDLTSSRAALAAAKPIAKPNTKPCGITYAG